MRRVQHSFALLAAATGVIGIATVAQAAAPNQSGSNQGQQPQQAAQEQSSNKQAQQAPEGWVLVDEQVITLTANEPQNHFLRAHEYLSANDPKAAAAEVRIAAGYLDMQASRKGDADQQELRTTSNDLRQLAGRIAQGASQQEKAEPQRSQQASNNGQSAEQKQLSQAFAHADEVLARHFQQEASNEINRHRPIMAGHDLDASAAALTASFAWSGEKCSKQCDQAVADARRLSDEILTPTPKAQAENANNKDNKEQDKEAKRTESNGEAQPAAARIQSQNQAETNRIPDDASKVVDELGKAIDSAGSEKQSKASDESAHPAKTGEQGAKSNAPSEK